MPEEQMNVRKTKWGKFHGDYIVGRMVGVRGN